MPQQHGLGRGLASLIPPKESTTAIQSLPTQSAATSPFVVPQPIAKPLVQPQPARLAGDLAKRAATEPEKQVSIDPSRMLDIPVERITPNPHQPRFHFPEEKLRELADSIQEHGIVQPLVVTRQGENFELIAGERRYQAAKLIGLPTVPAVVRTAQEQQKFELAIIENIQRHDLNPIEEAKAYQRLMQEFGLTQEDVARKMGKSRSAVGNTVRLLQLPAEVQRAIMDGIIAEGHAKALLAIDQSEKQHAVFERIVKEHLTVRDVETLSRSLTTRQPKRATTTDPRLTQEAARLTEYLGTRVRISQAGSGGKIVIEYYSDEELGQLLERLH